jgi:dUTP pyrophosphatase
VKKLTELATMPVRGSEFAAGFDLASAYDLSIPAGGKGLVKTDLAIAIPENTYARIAPRSGLAVKKFIDIGAGVVDYDYRGNVGVVLFNHGAEDFEVKRGDRVAQLILECISMAPCVEVQELDSTARGAGGFGSTGVNGGAGAMALEPATKKAREMVEGVAESPAASQDATTIRTLLARIEALEAKA